MPEPLFPIDEKSWRRRNIIRTHLRAKREIQIVPKGYPRQEARLLGKRRYVGGDIFSVASTQREIWHFGMRVQKEVCNFLPAEVRHPGDCRERRDVGTGLLLIAGHNMAG